MTYICYATVLGIVVAMGLLSTSLVNCILENFIDIAARITKILLDFEGHVNTTIVCFQYE